MVDFFVEVHIPVPWVIREHDYTVNFGCFFQKRHHFGRDISKKTLRGDYYVKGLEHYKVLTLPIFATIHRLLTFRVPVQICFFKGKSCSASLSSCMETWKNSGIPKRALDKPTVMLQFINYHWGHLGYLDPPQVELNGISHLAVSILTYGHFSRWCFLPTPLKHMLI